jgi:type VI secretion system protein ImpG
MKEEMVSRDDHFYYTQELRYLNQEGQYFAEKHPDIARQLGLEGVNAELRDPHSERVLEGFAFLTGRIRKMLDRQYPELAHALFNLVFPSYLRPVPSKTIVQLYTVEGMLDKPQTIPRGTEISGKIDQTRITFSTSHEILVQPLDLSRLYVDPEVKADFSISAELKIHEGVDPFVMDFDEVEFFIHGEPSVRFELFRQLNTELHAIEIKGIPASAGSLSIQWTGFEAGSAFLAEEDSSFLPLHLIRDYFDQPERFLFFKVKGLTDALAPLMDHLTSFQLDFSFNTPFSSGSLFNATNLLLHSCPCLNVFERAGEPISISGEELEYRLIPDISQPQMEVYSLEKVLISRERNQMEAHPYYHFDRDSNGQESNAFYALRREPRDQGGWDTFIRFFYLDQEGPSDIIDFIGSTRILVSQGNLARKIKIGQLDELDRTLPETIHVKNVTQASAPCWPKLYSTSDWDFISHLALNYNDIQKLAPLKTLLSLYNFGESETVKRKINGLLSLEKKRDYIIEQGRCINGFTLILHCDEEKFQHTGDLVLFGRVMGHFLRAYCPFNSFIRLRIEVGHHEMLLETVVTG